MYTRNTHTIHYYEKHESRVLKKLFEIKSTLLLGAESFQNSQSNYKQEDIFFFVLFVLCALFPTSILKKNV